MHSLLSACCAAVLMVPIGVMAQPSSAPQSSYGDRQAGHFGDPGAGYFGNPGDGSFANQSLDAARAKTALPPRTGASSRRAGAPSPYVVLEQPVKPKAKVKPVAGDAAPPAPSN